ncbi:DinB family protein [Pedobacter rhodius]|uniref:Damage-inducible protein DinB n=1 Tax=Pedobacter rhodius TaxID=3004098 RepID=A0ABT4L312_9SPHI|nr:DinB family protein [Pedobacter sp. SJ11]MCZ4225573.1 hypothetical protein [Pedobacter sp. SJ11]
MVDEFITYTELADKKVMEAFVSSDLHMPEAERLFSHVLNAQHIWAKRISGEAVIYDVWQEHKKENFNRISLNNFKLIHACLATKNFDEVLVYKNSKGEEFKNTVGEMFLHMLNHSTYHRGQIITLLKNSGIEPPVTDYIIFKRTNLL